MKAIALLLFAATLSSAAPMKPVPLAGKWRFALDPNDYGIKAGPENWKFPDTIQLPGLVTAQGFGENPSFATEWTGDGWRYPDMFKEWQAPDNFKFPFFLQPPLHYVGPAWFQRDIEIPTDWSGKHVTLHFERVHWQSTVWLDGRKVGGSDSLGTPHDFDLGSPVPGRHVLTLRIDNRLAPVNVGPLSHSVTDHTQGNWNGAVGSMELRAAPAARITQVEILPELSTGKVKLRVHTDGAVGNPKATILVTGAYQGPGPDDVEFRAKAVGVSGPVTAYTLTIPNAHPWDEFNAHRYQIEIHLDLPEARHTVIRTIGFREIANNDGQLTINGRGAFLRGTLECAIFPRLGHPPTDVAVWKRIIGVCKAHGLNHMRFHSWCPPEAAFAAADQLGFYLQPEVSSWANQGAQVGSGRPLDAWIDTETDRMLRAYGHHPSFVMLAYGNEPSGPKHRQWLQQWVARWKAKDPLRLYTTGAGWPVMAGSDWHSSPNPRIQRWGEGLGSIINAQSPRTDFDWSEAVRKNPDAPVISHEIGQWCVYPNFKEIDKYTGYFKARNFEIFRETARRNGLLGQSEEFLSASGKWQALAYKHDIEAALRTPGFGGFQLLDLHDFPGQGTALIGVLDAFWEEKGYISPEEYGRFSGPVVPLAKMKKMVFTVGDTLEADLQLAHFGPEDFASLAPQWTLSHEGKPIASGKLPPRKLVAGNLHELGTISVPLADLPNPAKLTLTVGAAGHDWSNHWDVFVYPNSEASDLRPGTFDTTTSVDDTLAALEAGKSVLWLVPPNRIRDDLEHPLKIGFSPIFWNTAWTKWQPPHTLGLLTEPKHPALAAFPTDAHTNWQWWEIVTRSRPFILTEHADLRPIVQPIDDWFTNRKLGLVFEARVGKGKLLACGIDLATDLDSRPAARQLRASLEAYLAGPDFKPATTLDPADLEALLRPVPLLEKLGAKASASSAETGYEAAQAIDGNSRTLWHTEFSARQPDPPHDLILRFPEPVAIKAVLVTQRQDKNRNGQVKGLAILADDCEIARTYIPMHAKEHRIKLPAGTRTGRLSLSVFSAHAGPFAAFAEVDIVP